MKHLKYFVTGLSLVLLVIAILVFGFYLFPEIGLIILSIITVIAFFFWIYGIGVMIFEL